MKIYILPVSKELRPDSQFYRYPQHNDDFGVEQDFYEYLLQEKTLLVQDPAAADWHYLPVYWTRWHINHNYGQHGLQELQRQISKAMLDSKKTFTICQYDDGPVVKMGDAVIFLSSRTGITGIDIPLLSSLHRKSMVIPKKKYRASFVGNLESHSLRQKMNQALKDKKEVYIFDSHQQISRLRQWLRQAYILLSFGNRSKFFVKKTLQSFIALCPRGYGGSSFRLYEAMQLGVVPFLIGDIDTRPFKKFINWNDISLYADTTTNIWERICLKTDQELLLMGQEAQRVYQEKLAYQKWCPYVLKELEHYGNY